MVTFMASQDDLQKKKAITILILLLWLHCIKVETRCKETGFEGCNEHFYVRSWNGCKYKSWKELYFYIANCGRPFIFLSFSTSDNLKYKNCNSDKLGESNVFCNFADMSFNNCTFFSILYIIILNKISLIFNYELEDLY